LAHTAGTLESGTEANAPFYTAPSGRLGEWQAQQLGKFEGPQADIEYCKRGLSCEDAMMTKYRRFICKCDNDWMTAADGSSLSRPKIQRVDSPALRGAGGRASTRKQQRHLYHRGAGAAEALSL
jgi:hypothetical protein